MEKRSRFSLHRPLALLLALVMMFALLASLPVSADNHTHEPVDPEATYGPIIETAVTGEANYKMAYEVLDEVNAERKKAGLKALEMDKDMMEYAMQRAAECNVYYNHIRPNGTSCFTIIKQHRGAGENIAAGYFTAKAVMSDWMDSSGHKANILTKDFQSIGVGVFKIGGIYYWCQLFNGMEKKANPTQKNAVTETRTIEARTKLLDLSINATELTLKDDETATLQITNCNLGFPYFNDPLDPSGLTFVPEEPGIVTVSKSGVITPIGNGSTTIAVNAKNGVKLFTVSVTAQVKNPHTEHDYTAATCTEPKTCKVCGVTSGKALGHVYDNGCDAKCNTCGETRKVSAHLYSNACDTTCNTCGATRKVGAHTWVKGTCSACGSFSPSKVTIITEPKTTYVMNGVKASVSVVANGEGLKYTWYIKNNGGKKYSKSSIAKATYSATMNDTSHNRYLYCIITDQYGNELKTKTVCIRRQATITAQSATAAYAQKGKKATVKISAVGDDLTYTWYIKAEGAFKYSKSSVTTATYSATMGDKVKGRKAYCVVTDKYGKSTKSKTFVLREKVSIVTQPKSVTVKKNATAKVTVKASGDGLKYTWYIKNAGTSKYIKSSVTSATYSTKMTNTAKNRLVYCVVTDKYGYTVKTIIVKLKMK